MAKQQKESAKWCKWNGMRMTVNQRNILMKSDYIHGGLTTKEIAAKYEVSFNTVANLVTNGKWVQARKNFLLETQRRADEAVMTAYAGMQVEITTMYNDAWTKLMTMVQMMLDNPRQYLMTTNGEVRVGRLQQIAEIMQMAQQGQERCVGFVDKQAQVNININQQRLEIYKKQVGEDEDDIVEDNFIEALEAACKDVWGEDAPKLGLGQNPLPDDMKNNTTLKDYTEVK